MKPNRKEQMMSSESLKNTVAITTLPGDKFTITIQGEDVTGELCAIADRDAIGADTVSLASATTTMPDRDELARFRDRISKLLGETFDAEAFRQRLVADIIESVKRVAAKHESAPDATRIRDVLDEVAAERERQREEPGSSSGGEITPVGWTGLHEHLLMQVAEARGYEEHIYSELPAENTAAVRVQCIRAMATYLAHVETIDLAEPTAQGETG